MSSIKHQGDGIADQMRSSEKIRGKMICVRRIKWLDREDDKHSAMTVSDDERPSGKPISRSMASTDLTRAARGAGEPYENDKNPDENDENPDVETGSAEDFGATTVQQQREQYDLMATPERTSGFEISVVTNPDVGTGSAEALGATTVQQQCERYSLVATPGCAGTFGMSVVGDPVFGPETNNLIEFTVWKTTVSPRKRLWFTVRHTMSLTAAAAVRSLEIWTDRNNSEYPEKVVFLPK